MRLQRVIGVLGLATACHTAGTPPADTTIADGTLLRVGQSLPLGGASLVFVGVASDSRCPSDVVCVWAGNAAAMFSLREGQTNEPRTINTTLEPRALQYLGLQVTIVSLTPVPKSTGTIDPSKYVVGVSVGPIENPE